MGSLSVVAGKGSCRFFGDLTVSASHDAGAEEAQEHGEEACQEGHLGDSRFDALMVGDILSRRQRQDDF